MKRLIIFINLIFLSIGAIAQADIKTESFKVDGNCNMCKKRIEEAAYVKGVKRAEWNKDTHVLTVIYKPSKTNIQVIAKSVARAGHSTETIAAADKDYESLPECCHYKTATCEH